MPHPWEGSALGPAHPHMPVRGAPGGQVPTRRGRVSRGRVLDPRPSSHVAWPLPAASTPGAPEREALDDAVQDPQPRSSFGWRG